MTPRFFPLRSETELIRARSNGETWQGTFCQDSVLLPHIEDICSAVCADGRLSMARLVTPTRTLDVLPQAERLDVEGAISRGWTLVLSAVHKIFASVRWVALNIPRNDGETVHANAYLSPPYSQGLARHIDRHDVLVIQSHGQKTWSVDALEKIDLEKGEGLFVPAGTAHLAHTDAAPSLHFTFGWTRSRNSETEHSVSCERPDALASGDSASVGSVPRGELAPITSRLAFASLERVKTLHWVRKPEVVDRGLTVCVLVVGSTERQLPCSLERALKVLIGRPAWRTTEVQARGAEILQLARYLVREGMLVTDAVW